MAPKKASKGYTKSLSSVAAAAAKSKGSKSGSSSAGADILGDDLKTTELKFAKGVQREYLITEPSKEIQEARSSKTSLEKMAIVALLAVAAFARLYKLSQPDSVVFDEVHFGGFARKYILGTYFMDVHPPLAKMLYGGVGFIFGFNGDFEFSKIGDVYPETVPYAMMRGFSALCGVGTIFMMYNTLRLSGCKPVIALATSSLLLIENSFFTISRYILLDAPLMFFISCAAFSLKRSELDTPFTYSWYKSLLATGVSLGLALSSKWVGLFTVGWVGILTIWNLWFVLGDISVSPSNLAKQVVSKLVFFLAVPITLYLYFFSIHYNILDKEGDGAAFMSAPFRSTLKGNKLPTDILADVGVASKVSLRHVNTQGGYLHSHNHLFETGSKQQQVTLYPHLDENNIFQVELYNVSEYPTEFVPITDGTKIRLKHIQTQRRIHSHDHKPPVSENADWQKEVSAYGFEGFEGDPNDDFIVEIVSSQSASGDAQKRVRALETIFKLRHAMTGCYLFSHEVKLPSWAFDQQEVTCATQGIEPLLLWTVETNENEFLPVDAERVNYKAPSFIAKVIESHKKMWKINQGLTESHHWESSPDSWPFLLRGINYWGRNNTQVYLFGNMTVWWCTTATIALFAIYVAIQVLRWQRGYTVASSPEVFNFNVQTVHFLLGWGLHYAPSFLMGRQLFLHHYLPAYYFGILAFGHALELIHSYFLKNKKQISYMILVTLFACAFTSFWKYSSLIKGDPWTKAECNASKLISTWDFDCNAFLDSSSAYESLTTSMHQASETPSFDFNDAVAVPQNEEFAQEPNDAIDQKQVPESEDAVDANISPVSVKKTPGEEASSVENVADASESSTVPDLVENEIDPATDKKDNKQDVEQLELFTSAKGGPKKPKGNGNGVVMQKDGKYYDEDMNEILDEAVVASIKKVTEDFPFDKLTMKQKRRKGDAMSTVIP